MSNSEKNTAEEEILPILPPAVAAVQRAAKEVERQARRVEEEAVRVEIQAEREAGRLLPIIDPLVLEAELEVLKIELLAFSERFREEIENLSKKLERIIKNVDEEKKP